MNDDSRLDCSDMIDPRAEADREAFLRILDDKMAKMMGLVKEEYTLRDSPSIFYWVGSNPEFIIDEADWHPSIDIGQAMEVLKRLLMKRVAAEFELYMQRHGDKIDIQVAILYCYGDLDSVEANADTAELAICLAIGEVIDAEAASKGNLVK